MTRWILMVGATVAWAAALTWALVHPSQSPWRWALWALSSLLSLATLLIVRRQRRRRRVYRWPDGDAVYTWTVDVPTERVWVTPKPKHGDEPPEAA